MMYWRPAKSDDYYPGWKLAHPDWRRGPLKAWLVLPSDRDWYSGFGLVPVFQPVHLHAIWYTKPEHARIARFYFSVCDWLRGVGWRSNN